MGEAAGVTVAWLGTVYMLIIFAVLLASALITWLIRRYLLLKRVLDIPNARSSHSIPTPRGGGLSIVIVFLTAVLLFARRGTLSRGLVWALAGGGLVVALAGILDDQFHVSVRLRLLMHFAAAAWALWHLHGIGPLHLGWTMWHWGWIGQVVALVGLVWMINLYNFMDGIDGLAGVEALCVSSSGTLLLAGSGLTGLAEATLVLAAAAAGFLMWNWPPAKVFMGDVGSGFLGFVFGVLLVASANQRPALLWPWLILVSVFLVDSMLTLVRRWFSGARWYEAHCCHAYQHAARLWHSHAKVTAAVLLINLAWLFPLAWGACGWPEAGPLFVLVAITPLIYTAFRCHAGQNISFHDRPSLSVAETPASSYDHAA